MNTFRELIEGKKSPKEMDDIEKFLSKYSIVRTDTDVGGAWANTSFNFTDRNAQTHKDIARIMKEVQAKFKIGNGKIGKGVRDINISHDAFSVNEAKNSRIAGEFRQGDEVKSDSHEGDLVIKSLRPLVIVDKDGNKIKRVRLSNLSLNEGKDQHDNDVEEESLETYELG